MTKQIRRQLIAMRLRHGATSKVGRYCSVLSEQLKNYNSAGDNQKSYLQRSIVKSVEELRKMIPPT